MYDTLPSPNNLHHLGLVEYPNCKLCGKRGTMAHVLSDCQVALTQGRYTHVDGDMTGEGNDQQTRSQDKRQGEATADKRARRQKSVLDRGHDWELGVDLDRKLVFPNIVETNLRLDVVLVSQQSKTLVAIELTVPRQENCEEAHERKSLKYADLMAD